jgi:hypothetical protein
VGDDTATIRCQYCDTPISRSGRRAFCDDDCRKAAWRRRHRAPSRPTPAKPTTIYECDNCGERYLGEQRCPDCNTWCRKIASGGPCPHCDGLVAITDIIDDNQFAQPLTSHRAKQTP